MIKPAVTRMPFTLLSLQRSNLRFYPLPLQGLAVGRQGTLSVPGFGQPVPQLDGPIPGLALVEADGGPQPGNGPFLLLPVE
jgi:hypothetical protein